MLLIRGGKQDCDLLKTQRHQPSDMRQPYHLGEVHRRAPYNKMPSVMPPSIFLWAVFFFFSANIESGVSLAKT